MRNVAIVFLATLAVTSELSATTGTDTALSFALQNIGGSVVKPLISKCNKYEYSSTRLSCEELMKNFGSVGPIRMYRPTKTKYFSRYERTGYFEGASSSGDHVSGDIFSRKNYSTSKDLSWRVEVPKGFYDEVKKIEGLAKMKNAEACAEMGAIIFSGAMKGRMGYSERKMLEYFDRASSLGSQNGKFMKGFCLYYGIGTIKNRDTASKVISEWAATNSINTGWASEILKKK